MEQQTVYPIPPRIHAVWVGGKEPPALIRRCMRSWRRHCPDYEIKLWTEANFDLEAHPFAREAYKQKKWAFVSDYIRAWALYHEGGIYLDTDNVLQRNLDHFRRHEAFVGFERPGYPFTACFGCRAGHPLAADILALYEGQHFQIDEENPLPFNNTISVSDLLVERYGANRENREQDLPQGLHLYPDRVLCNPSADSAVIHVFTGTWLGRRSRLQRFVTSLKSHLDRPWKARLYARLFRS